MQVFLQELHLDNNRLPNVPTASFVYLFNLKILNMSGNRLRELKDSSLDNVAGLIELDLSRNLGLRTISERAFHNVTKLNRLNLSHNNLSTFFTRTFLPMMELHDLVVEDNRIPYIPVAMQGLRQVRKLLLSGNKALKRLKEIPEAKAVMPEVEELLIEDTGLEAVAPGDFDLFPNLRELSLANNRLDRVGHYTFRSLSKLERLDLSRNDITNLSREKFMGLAGIKALNLSHNLILGLDTFPPDMGRLIILDLSFNKLRTVPRDTLKHLSRLVRLDLRGNQLVELLPEVLRPLAALRSLDLGDNAFSSLPLDGIRAVEDTLQNLNLDGEEAINVF